MSCHEFWSGSVSKDFANDEMSEISLNGIVYDSFVDDSAIKQEDVLNICDYLLIKTNTK